MTEAGGRFLETPVSGTKKPAEDGTLIILCAGDESLYAEAGPLLDLMGRKRVFLGAVGAELLFHVINGVVQLEGVHSLRFRNRPLPGGSSSRSGARRGWPAPPPTAR